MSDTNPALNTGGGTFYQLIRANRQRARLLLVVAFMFEVITTAAAGALLVTSINMRVTIDGVDRSLIVKLYAVAFFAAIGAIVGLFRVMRALRARPDRESYPDVRLLEPNEEMQLQNVVRELATAANLPTPRVGVVETAHINAVALGEQPGLIVITRGLLEALDREALSGAMAVMIARIRNLDTRLDARLEALSARPSKRAGCLALLMPLLFLTYIIGLALRWVLRLFINSRRTYLADATAVEISRNPIGVEKALTAAAADREFIALRGSVLDHPGRLVDVAIGWSAKVLRGQPGLIERAQQRRALIINDRINELRGLRGAELLPELSPFVVSIEVVPATRAAPLIAPEIPNDKSPSALDALLDNERPKD